MSDFGISSGKVAGEESVGVEADDVDEMRQPRKINRPRAPTEKDMDDRLPLHLEYREWCPACVARKGLSTQHRST